VIEQGLMLHRQGRLAEAEAIYRAVLAREPNRFEPKYLIAHLKYQQGMTTEAHVLLVEVLAKYPQSIEAWTLQSGVLMQLDRIEEALSACEQALRLNPGNAEAHHNRAILLARLNRNDEALEAFDRALTIQPDFLSAHFNRANLLAGMRRYEEAISAYDAIVANAPRHVDTINNRGNALAALGRSEEALACFERALSIDANHLNALNNRGISLQERGRLADALASFEKALAVNPSSIEALFNRGNTLILLGQFKDACDSLERVLALAPGHAGALTALANARARMCDWSGAEALLGAVRDAADRGGIHPFTLLTLDLEPAQHLGCTRRYVQEQLAHPAPLPASLRNPHSRIKVAYLSSDFRDHPVSYLTARLFELHDRSAFEVHAISFGADDNSALRARIVAAVEHFHDVRAMSDRAVATLMAQQEIDIAIDLNGHTTGARPGILTLRPCPIQVSYLGFAGTSGTDFLDYILVDRIVVPMEEQPFYSEKLVELPDCFLINDPSRVIAQAPTRTDAGLPNEGFVFCCFNNPAKITARLFDLWTDILSEVDGSILWLSQLNAPAQTNLRAAAERRGIDPARIAFAPRCPKPEDHLARLSLADLFLDTLPYNAHTTAWDALFAGVPVLTCRGRSFPGRVAASLLQAVDLPELITSSLPDYRALALALAQDRGRLNSIKRKLAMTRDRARLFDTARLARNIETAYAMMLERHRNGEAPSSLVVVPQSLEEG
jgi:protein O-GlcNAc transferase